MSPSTLLNVFVLAALSLAGANAQVTGTYPATPLASKTFTYPSGIPEKVDTDTGLIRGFQHGYNQCNSTTEGPNSLCQTSFINSIDDFVFGPPANPDLWSLTRKARWLHGAPNLDVEHARSLNTPSKAYAPNNAQNGTFESCEGENQDFPGVYTVNGQVMTYAQPPESEGPITTMPYTARIPASSNCVTYTSSALYTDLPSPSIQIDAVSTALPSGASGSGSPSGSRTGAAAGAQNTSNDASSLAISGVSFLGVVFSILFLA
ncbi:hypothetical protein AGABI2DRAFT_177546 [Agaricus bisporus var. bisporus H97]|uniref:hypothetical protein n=1 Tax=Agaricus bisporus var. bisporus (strain H97 / ATCC MYA-4626 / FGSC 10389) TaxID=936046 RepID=UPI00029F76DE|nr:hypothetical protein AGABI2DRAFT_177546 [Agaricus bisporus var. bisporus H97]EKV49628.1 hypothetical protein AGABI2DRAFT_177546 [Agaricus bisporus var. bisporus H97]